MSQIESTVRVGASIGADRDPEDYAAYLATLSDAERRADALIEQAHDLTEAAGLGFRYGPLNIHKVRELLDAAGALIGEARAYDVFARFHSEYTDSMPEFVNLWNGDEVPASKASLYVPRDRVTGVIGEAVYIYADADRQEAAEETCPLPEVVRA